MFGMGDHAMQACIECIVQMTHCAAATLSHAVMEGLLVTNLTVSDKLKINDLMLVLDGWINFENCLKCTQSSL